MSHLINVLLDPGAGLRLGQIWLAMDQSPLGEIIGGEEYGCLAEAIGDVDPKAGGAFLAQLALAKKLAKRGEEPKIAKLRSSLAFLFQETLIQGEIKLRQAMENRFAQRRGVRERLAETLAGSHWKLETEVPRRLDSALALPPEKINVAGTEITPPLHPPPPLKRRQNLMERLTGLLRQENPAPSAPSSIAPRPDAPSLAANTHIGSRTTQQDYTLGFEGKLADGRAVVLSIVTDGNGQSGEIASQVAAKTFMNRLLGWLTRFPDGPLLAMIEEAIHYADQKIPEATPTGKTTFVAYLQAGDEKYVVNVGDSQAFFMSDSGKYTKITIDHAVGNRLIRRLGTTPGSEGDPTLFSLADPDIFVPTLPVSGLIFLFSDGIQGSVGETAARSWPTASLPELARRVIDLNLELGAYHDNMTVNVVQVK